MIADIFYPIFTLTITISVCFIPTKKKLFGGFVPILSPGYHSGSPGGLQLPLHPPAAIAFGFAKNQCAHIFSVLPPAWRCVDLPVIDCDIELDLR